MQQESPGIADNSSMLCKAQGGMEDEAPAVLGYEGEYSGAQGGLGRGEALVWYHPHCSNQHFSTWRKHGYMQDIRSTLATLPHSVEMIGLCGPASDKTP